MWSARVSGHHCVVADTWNGLFVVDVEKTSRPKIVAHAVLPDHPIWKVPDPVGGIALGDGSIYAAGIGTGLYRIPAPGMASPVVREPDSGPKISRTKSRSERDSPFTAYHPNGQVRSVSVVDDTAWIACGSAGIHAVRLGKTMEPLSITPGKGNVFHVAVSGGLLYSAENNAGLAIYRIGSNFKLTEIGRLKDGGKMIKQVSCPAPGKFALFHCGTAQACIADVSDPANPKVVLRDSQVGLFYGDQLVRKMMDDRFLIAYWHRSGPAWYDVSGDQPILKGNSPDKRMYSFADGATVFHDKLLLITKGKLQLLEPGEMREVSQLPKFGVEGRHLRGRPATDGKLLALSRRHEQVVELFDISDVRNPKPVEEYRLSGHPGACDFWKGRLVIPAGYGGLLLQKE